MKRKEKKIHVQIKAKVSV